MTESKKKLGGVYSSLVYAPTIKGYEMSIKLLKKRGVLCIGGLPPTEEGYIPLTPMDMNIGYYSVTTALIGTRQDQKEVFQLAAEGKIKSQIFSTYPLDKVNEVHQKMYNGEIKGGRAVLTP